MPQVWPDAPKPSDKDDRGSRVARAGHADKRALEGFTGAKGMMPARGGSSSLPDDDVRPPWTTWSACPAKGRSAMHSINPLREADPGGAWPWRCLLGSACRSARGHNATDATVERSRRALSGYAGRYRCLWRHPGTPAGRCQTGLAGNGRAWPRS